MAQLKVHPTKHQSLDVSIEMLIMSTFGTIISFINKGDHRCRRRPAEPPPRRVLLLAQVSRWAVQLCDQGTGSCLVWQNPIFVIYSIGSATCQCGFSLNSRAKRLISIFFFFLNPPPLQLSTKIYYQNLQYFSLFLHIDLFHWPIFPDFISSVPD